MALITRNPTSNTTPDPGQGGLAVTDNTNTGHGSTTLLTVGEDDKFATCLWTGFSSVVGPVQSVTLKFDWSEDGSLSGGGVNNFRVQYSVNGGGAWNDAINHTNITSPNSGSAQVSLSASQDLTQVQVRDFIESSSPAGGTASTTASVSNIKIEVRTSDSLVVMM